MKKEILVCLIVLAAWTGSSLSAMGQSTTVLFEGFEGSFPSDNGWSVGNPTGGESWEDVNSAFGGEGTHTGNWKGYCAGTAYSGNSSEPNPTYPPLDTDAYMSRDIDLRGYGCASLTFWYKIPSIAAADCNVFFGGDLVWSRSTPAGGWNFVEIPLDSYADGEHTLEFRFVALDEFFAEGWYLDDIQVTATRPSNDFFANAAVIAAPGGQITGTSACATKELGEPIHPNNGGGSSV